MAQLTTVRELQQRISHMQPLRTHSVLPTRPELAALLPGGALQGGTAVSVRGSLQLALALLSAASCSGAWCGAIGVPELGAEAAHRLGVTLERFILVPSPESRTLTVISTLSEVLTVLLVRVITPPEPHEAERIHAKLREYGSALITLGAWPRTTTELRIARSQWSGVSQGRGMLEARQLSVQSRDRRGQLTHTVHLTSETPPSPFSVGEPCHEI